MILFLFSTVSSGLYVQIFMNLLMIFDITPIDLSLDHISEKVNPEFEQKTIKIFFMNLIFSVCS